MPPTILGLHHVTAIAGDPQRNLDFYVGTLGLRLVKKTVNFDDPATYHLYYGDEVGRPGSILTFFPWKGAPRGRIGTGQATVTTFAAPDTAAKYWIDRLKSAGVAGDGLIERWGERLIAFEDPDGLRLEIAFQPGTMPGPSGDAGDVPNEFAIRSIAGVTLEIEGFERTGKLLTDTLGFKIELQEGSRYRYTIGDGEPGNRVDLVCKPGGPSGALGVGTIHHVAFRTANDADQVAWRREIVSQGYNVSPVMDREYFHSIYFREPGRVLFEIATDPPGFAVDEPETELGKTLKLPPWLESERAILERTLPPLKLPR